MSITKRITNVALITVLTVLGLLVIPAGIASATKPHDDDDRKPSVCHPVEGNGETGYGWNIIEPDKASSHIDEETGAGKHTRKDGRTDVYAVNGKCPEPPPVTTEPPVTEPPVTVPPTVLPTDCSTGVVIDGECQPTGGTSEDTPVVTSTTTTPATATALPATGVNNWLVAAIAMGLIVAGGAMVRATRRKGSVDT